MRYFDQSKSMLTDWYNRSIQQGLCSGLPSSSGVNFLLILISFLLHFIFYSLLFDVFDLFSLSSLSIILVALPGATRPHGLGTWNPMQCYFMVSTMVTYNQSCFILYIRIISYIISFPLFRFYTNGKIEGCGGWVFKNERTMLCIVQLNSSWVSKAVKVVSSDRSWEFMSSSFYEARTKLVSHGNEKRCNSVGMTAPKTYPWLEKQVLSFVLFDRALPWYSDASSERGLRHLAYVSNTKPRKRGQ